MNGDITTIEEERAAKLREDIQKEEMAAQEETAPEEAAPASADSSSLISGAEAAVAITAGGLIDLLQWLALFVPGAGPFMASAISAIAGICAYLWMKLRSLKMSGAGFLKNWGTWLAGITTGIEIIPGLNNILPTWLAFTTSVIITNRLQSLKQIIQKFKKVFSKE